MQTEHTRTGRPRDPAVQEAILQATQELLADIGYDRMSIESVAAHCGTGKTTIYRRWPDKATLVADAIAATHSAREITDTGTLRADLITFAAQWHTRDSRRDEIVGGLLTAMRQHPELKTAVDEAISLPAQQAFRLMVRRALDRGEITDGRPVDLIGTVLPAMVFFHITEFNAPVDLQFITDVIDHVVLPAIGRPNEPGPHHGG